MGWPVEFLLFGHLEGMAGTMLGARAGLVGLTLSIKRVSVAWGVCVGTTLLEENQQRHESVIPYLAMA